MAELLGTFEYLGYTASINYDDVDDVYYGRILDIPGLFSFHADSIPALKEEFILAVEYYEDLRT